MMHSIGCHRFRNDLMMPSSDRRVSLQDAGDDSGKEKRVTRRVRHERIRPESLEETKAHLSKSRKALHYLARRDQQTREELKKETAKNQMLQEKTQDLERHVLYQDAKIQSMKEHHQAELEEINQSICHNVDVMQNVLEHSQSLSQEILRLKEELKKARAGTKETHQTPMNSMVLQRPAAQEIQAATTIQKFARRNLTCVERCNAAALQIQTFYRQYLAKRMLFSMRKVAVWVQKRERGRRDRQFIKREKLRTLPQTTVEVERDLSLVEKKLNDAVKNSKESKDETAALVESLSAVMWAASDCSKPCTLGMSELVALDDLMANVIDRTIEGRMELEELIEGLEKLSQ